MLKVSEVHVRNSILKDAKSSRMNNVQYFPITATSGKYFKRLTGEAVIAREGTVVRVGGAIRFEGQCSWNQQLLQQCQKDIQSIVMLNKNPYQNVCS